MIRAVLFDLDGTLLDIDLTGFLRDYLGVLGAAVSPLVEGHTPRAAAGAVMQAVEAMSASHPALTNREAFNLRFRQLTGVDMDESGPRDTLEEFYRDVFPSLNSTHKARAGARDACSAARGAGCRIALATNPIFPRVAIEERARWAGFTLDEFDMVTSYENACACKPDLAYFMWVAETLGVEPSEALMVGDDEHLDLPAAHAGLMTYYVGRSEAVGSLGRGDLNDLARLLTSGSHRT